MTLGSSNDNWLTLSSAGSIAGGASITVATGSEVNLTGTLSGSGSLTDNASGSGFLKVAGTNSSFSGSVTLNSGLLYVGATSHALGSGTLALDGGTILNAVAGTATLANPFTVSGTPTIANGNSLTFSGAGTLSQAATLTVSNNASTITLSGGVSGPGAITENGAGGTFVLSGTNTYIGATTISAGTLQVGAANSIPSTSDVTDNATVDLDDHSDTIGALSGTGTVTSSAAGAVTLTVGTPFRRRRRILGRDPGRQRHRDLCQDRHGHGNPFRRQHLHRRHHGNRRHAFHQRRQQPRRAQAGPPGSIMLNGGTLQATATFTLNSNRGIALGPTSGSGGGTIDVTSGNTLTYGGILANNGGTGSLTMTDTGIQPAGQQHLAAARRSSAIGTLQIGNGGITGSLGSGSVTDNAAVVYDLSSNVAVSNAISGAGALTLTSTAGNVSQSAAITVPTLTVSVATGITLTNASNTDSSFSAINTTSGNISLTDAANLSVVGITQSSSGSVTVSVTGGSNALTVSGTVTGGGGSVTLQAAGNVTVAASQTVNSGTGALTLFADSGAAGAGTLAINGNVYGSNITLRDAGQNIAATATVGNASGTPTVNNSYITGLDEPNAVAFDASGNLYVTNSVSNNGADNGTVSEYSSSGALINASYIPATDGLNHPYGMAFDSSGNLYVANSEGTTVSKFSSSGSLINSTYISGLSDPSFLAFDSSGNLYVANLGSGTVSEQIQLVKGTGINAFLY